MTRSVRVRWLLLVTACAVGQGLRADAPPGGWTEVVSELKRAVVSGQSELARAAVEKLAQTEEVRGYRLIIEHALGGQDYRLFSYAAGVLVALQGPEFREEVYRALKKSRNPKTRIILLAVVKRWASADEKAIVAIHERLEDPRKAVVLAALKWIRELNMPKRSIGPLIVVLKRHEKNRGRVRFDIQSTLHHFTGYDLETAADWENYWAARKNEPQIVRKSDDGKVKSRTRVFRAPKFFSVSVDSNRVVFLIDTSTSMAKKKRIHVAKKELVRTIESLPPSAYFNVIAFSHELRIFHDGAGLVQATRANTSKAVRWVNSLVPSGLTRTDKALYRALKLPDVDTIFLLTDGIPKRLGQDGVGVRIPAGSVLQMVQEENRFRKCRINTFGFADSGMSMQAFVKDLARENDGRCVLLK